MKKKLYGGKLNEDRIPKIKRIIIIKNLYVVLVPI